MAMYVCHCRVVTDTQIREAIRCGARDVCAIAEACGAGGRCGGCLPAVRRLLQEHGLPSDGPSSARTLRAQLLQRHAMPSVSAVGNLAAAPSPRAV
ncbi:MAG: (2Fe-2S)-binding protein [Actinomycetota bacterium]|nr:(2Fe-2S)-binding protein [Actinomycetota bacterium]